MPTDECRKNDGISKIPFGNQHSVKTRKGVSMGAKNSGLKFDDEWGSCIISRPFLQNT